MEPFYRKIDKISVGGLVRLKGARTRLYRVLAIRELKPRHMLRKAVFLEVVLVLYFDRCGLQLAKRAKPRLILPGQVEPVEKV